jgi:hypothetical protein
LGFISPATACATRTLSNSPIAAPCEPGKKISAFVRTSTIAGLSEEFRTELEKAGIRVEIVDVPRLGE